MRLPISLNSLKLPGCGVLLVLAGLVAYSNSFTGPFVFDDGYVTTNNPTIRQLWPLSVPLLPPADSTIGGRPLLNLSFALNYALGGYNTVGYHAVNLLIHLLVGLTLFGVVRRTLILAGTRVPSRPPDVRGLPSLPLSFAIALLWLSHPLQTEAVTYISQRAESLMSLFYLLTLYCFIRTVESKSKLWPTICVLSCLLGMTVKEVMVTAPLMVFLYDRTFLAGTFRVAWQQRWKLHAALFSTWLLLAWLLHDIRHREVGLGYGVSCWHYALTQCRALVLYLGLVIWPHPLVIDRGINMVSEPLTVLPQAIVVLVLLGITLWALFRRPSLGFAGAWCWIILAPTSSFLPVPLSPIAEHRLYLPLASLLTLFVVGLYRLLGKYSFWAFGVLALIWGTLTFLRNEDYSSSLALWQQTVAHSPDNPRAHNNLGEFLVLENQPDAAVAEFQETLRLDRDYHQAHNNWGFVLAQHGYPLQAIAHYQEAFRIKPDDPEIQNNWGNALAQLGKFDEAADHYQEAVRLNPAYAEAEFNWGNACLQAKQPNDAIAHFQKAITMNPLFAEPHNNLGVILFQMGRKDEAIAQFQQALRIDPQNAKAKNNLTSLGAPETPAPGP